MDTEPTPRQKEILDHIAEHLREAGRPPTLRELARRFGVVMGAIQDHLAALEAKGFLKREKGRARGLVLAAGAGGALPLLGRVAAGHPLEAVENVEARVSLDYSLAAKADFILKVKGDSMEPEMMEGDLVLVRRARDAEDGQVVIAHVGEGEATVKRLRRRGRKVFLEAANPKYAPIAREFQVIGRVVGLVRRYVS